MTAVPTLTMSAPPDSPDPSDPTPVWAPSPAPGEGWVDAEAVAAYLGVSLKTVFRWNTERRLPRYRLGNRNRYRLSEIDAWVRQYAVDDDADG